METYFTGVCLSCNQDTSFSKNTLDDYCGDVRFGVILFTGGFAVSPREISVFFGFGRKAKAGNCLNCGTTIVQCPYCETLMHLEEASEEVCPKCSKEFYLCV